MEETRNVKEEARREFLWSVHMSRLCAATVRSHYQKDLTKEEAEKTTRAEALDYIEAARKHCAKWIDTEAKWGNIDEAQASEARQALDEIAEETKRQAEALPD